MICCCVVERVSQLLYSRERSVGRSLRTDLQISVYLHSERRSGLLKRLILSIYKFSHLTGAEDVLRRSFVSLFCREVGGNVRPGDLFWV